MKEVVTAAFAKNAVFGGTIGVIIQQGVKRGTFSAHPVWVKLLLQPQQQRQVIR
ncbi:MAG: alanine:cation symporter family protein [Coprococcus sp.]